MPDRGNTRGREAREGDQHASLKQLPALPPLTSGQARDNSRWLGFRESVAQTERLAADKGGKMHTGWAR